MNWIKCSDRLPDIDIPVFLLNGEVVIIGARADTNDGQWCWGWALTPPVLYEGSWSVEGYEIDDFSPSHWHPLPTMPAK